jgi:NAD(P)-dependent dehydrogenase (short-subunit alcohol dehydrogenase family)
MKIDGSVAFVTGANRGLGAVLARALRDRGAATVYAGARDPSTITEPGLVPVRLDVTDPAAVAAAAARYGDVNLLINNAGVSRSGSRSADDARLEMEANYFGPLAMSRAFSPVLARNGGGALVNVLSVLSWVTFPAVATYAASKAAAWSLTNALRQELGEQGTQVVGVHVGYIDTDMAAHITSEKVKPEDVAAAILDGLEAGLSEVLVDDLSRGAKATLSNPL